MHQSPAPGSESRIQKAFYAMTQYRETIAAIMLDTPELARMYRVLLWLGTTTIAVAVLTTGFSFLTTGYSIGTIAAFTVFAILFYLLPLQAALLSTVVGALGLAVQLHPVIPALSLPVLYTAVGIGALGTSIVTAYLARHAMIIGSQVWEQLIEAETSTPSDPNETTNPEKDATRDSSSSQVE